jgi:hypothetical protein
MLLIPVVAFAFGQATDGTAPEDELLVIGSTYRIHHPSVTADLEYKILAYSPRGWVKVGRPNQEKQGVWLNLQHITALFPAKAGQAAD